MKGLNRATHLLLFPDPDGSVVGAGRNYLAVLRRSPDDLNESARWGRRRRLELRTLLMLAS